MSLAIYHNIFYYNIKETNDGCSHNCSNTEGCYYIDGYKLDSNGVTCLGTHAIYDVKHMMLHHIVCLSICILLLFLDINECEDDNGGCSHNCTNTDGSFECSCNDGYELDNNGATCLGTHVIFDVQHMMLHHIVCLSI